MSSGLGLGHGSCARHDAGQGVTSALASPARRYATARISAQILFLATGEPAGQRPAALVDLESWPNSGHRAATKALRDQVPRTLRPAMLLGCAKPSRATLGGTKPLRGYP